MRVFKVSFLMRSPSVNWEYKAANSRDLADDLTAAMEKAVAPVKPIRLSKGTIQHHFYVDSEGTAEQHREIAARLLASLIPDEKLRRMIIISVTEPEQEELDRLKQAAAALRPALKAGTVLCLRLRPRAMRMALLN